MASLIQTYGPMFRKPLGFVVAITEPPLPDSITMRLGTCAATKVDNIRTNSIDHTDFREFILPALVFWIEKPWNSTASTLCELSCGRREVVKFLKLCEIAVYVGVAISKIDFQVALWICMKLHQ